MMSMPPACEGTAYFTLASHDGIGLRPAEGLVDEQQRDDLDQMEQMGGEVWRSSADGVDTPMRSISVSSMPSRPVTTGVDAMVVERFLCAFILLAIEGISSFTFIACWRATITNGSRPPGTLEP